MNTKTMEGLVGAGTNMKMTETPMRVFKEARRRGDIATMERAMGYVSEFSERSGEYKSEADQGMKEDAEEARKKAELEAEKAIQKRREEREQQKEQLEESKNKGKSVGLIEIFSPDVSASGKNTVFLTLLKNSKEKNGKLGVNELA